MGRRHRTEISFVDPPAAGEAPLADGVETDQPPPPAAGEAPLADGVADVRAQIAARLSEIGEELAGIGDPLDERMSMVRRRMKLIEKARADFEVAQRRVLEMEDEENRAFPESQRKLEKRHALLAERDMLHKRLDYLRRHGK